MRDYWSFRTHPGIRASQTRPNYLLSGDTIASPQCEKHDVDLETVDVDGLDLKDGYTLAVCPQCFESHDGEIDTGALESQLRQNWDEYQTHFEQETPPEGSDYDPHFEVY